MENIKLILTEDGSYTLYNADVNEHFHSIHGAVGESVHIFIKAGLQHVANSLKEINLLEIGFGTGLNALLTLIESNRSNLSVNYTAIEPNPLPEEVVKQLGYAIHLGFAELENVFLKLHDSFKEEAFTGNDKFKFKGIIGKFQEVELNVSKFDLVYFDAFSPETEPTLWTEDIFIRLHSLMNTGGILVTYCCKGSVRRLLEACNFETERLPGPPGKHQILRATKL